MWKSTAVNPGLVHAFADHEDPSLPKHHLSSTCTSGYPASYLLSMIGCPDTFDIHAPCRFGKRFRHFLFSIFLTLIFAWFLVFTFSTYYQTISHHSEDQAKGATDSSLIIRILDDISWVCIMLRNGLILVLASRSAETFHSLTYELSKLSSSIHSNKPTSARSTPWVISGAKYAVGHFAVSFVAVILTSLLCLTYWNHPDYSQFHTAWPLDPFPISVQYWQISIFMITLCFLPFVLAQSVLSSIVGLGHEAFVLMTSVNQSLENSAKSTNVKQTAFGRPTHGYHQVAHPFNDIGWKCAPLGKTIVLNPFADVPYEAGRSANKMHPTFTHLHTNPSHCMQFVRTNVKPNIFTDSDISSGSRTGSVPGSHGTDEPSSESDVYQPMEHAIGELRFQHFKICRFVDEISENFSGILLIALMADLISAIGFVGVIIGYKSSPRADPMMVLFDRAYQGIAASLWMVFFLCAEYWPFVKLHEEAERTYHLVHKLSLVNGNRMYQREITHFLLSTKDAHVGVIAGKLFLFSRNLCATIVSFLCSFGVILYELLHKDQSGGLASIIESGALGHGLNGTLNTSLLLEHGNSSSSGRHGSMEL